MAFQVAKQTDSGIVVHDAYARIDSISGNKERIDFRLFYYVDQDAVASKPPFHQEQYSFTPSVATGAPDFIKQCYEYLKEQPEFENAVDVLEAGQAA